MKEKQIIVQKMHDVLYYYLGKKLYIQFHLMTKRAIKKGKNKSYKKNRLSYAFNYWLTFAFMPLKYVLNIQQKAVIASQQKTFPKGGVVKSNIEKNKGELINLPDGSTIIPPDIARQIANSNDKINIEVKLNDEKLDQKFIDDLENFQKKYCKK